MKNLYIKVKTAPQNILTEKSLFPCLGDGNSQALHCQGILRSHVDKAMFSADSVAGNEHSLQDRMRIRLHNRPILKCPWIAFITVADHVLPVASRPAADLPFLPRQEASAAKSAKPGALHLVDNLLRSKLKKGLTQCLVAANGKIVIDVLRVDIATISEHQALLLIVEGDVTVVGYRFVGNRIAVEETFCELPPRQK